MATASKRILIVDDEEDFLKIFKATLEIRGFEVVTASNAIAAGIALATHVPALILMDIRMPGINGFQACEAIKRNPVTKDIPIIIMSGLAADADIKRAYKIGVAEFFTKPVPIETLIQKIREILKIG